MVGDRPGVRPCPGVSLPACTRCVEQLAWWMTSKFAAERRVLVLERVEAVRAGGDDLLDPGLVQRLDVRLGLLLVQVLVAQAPRRGRRCRTPWARGSPKRDAGPVEHPGGGLGRPCGPARRGRRRSRPSRGTRRRRGSSPVITGTSKSRLSSPLGALGAAEAPRVALVLDVAQHEAGLGRELGLHQHLVAAHVDDGVDVLDVDRALLDARAAGGAGPQHVGVDDAWATSVARAVRPRRVSMLGRPRRTCCRAAP